MIARREYEAAARLRPLKEARGAEASMRRFMLYNYEGPSRFLHGYEVREAPRVH